MTEDSFEGEGRIGARLGALGETRSYSVAPGKTLSLPLVVANRGLIPDHFQLSVDGIPPTWVSTASPVTALSPGEQQELDLVIRPPADVEDLLGRYQFTVQILSQADPGDRLEIEALLTVAALAVEGPEIDLLLAATDWTVAPGTELKLPILLASHSSEVVGLQLSVDTIPAEWLPGPTPPVQLSAGEHRRVSLIVRPPAFPEGRAGRYSFRVQVFRQVTRPPAPDPSALQQAAPPVPSPELMAEAECHLIVTASEVQGPPAILLPATSFNVAPDRTLSLPFMLLNDGPDQTVQLSVVGIPASWVSIPAPIVHLAAGEQRELCLSVQPSGATSGAVGRHSFVIRLIGQEANGLVSEAECQLTVAAVRVEGRITVLLGSGEFSVVPGDSVTIPVVLANRGLDEDSFRIAVDGIPSTWVSTDSAVTHLAPGQQRQISLTIRPARSMQSRAGRHPFTIRVASQAAPDQVAEAPCMLSMAAFSQFRSELRPQRLEAGQPGRVSVDNQGNVQQAFTVTWQSPQDELLFEPGPTQELRVPPGQAGLLEFRASLRRRPLLGGEKVYPFTARIESADREAQNLGGDVVSRGLLPGWLLPAMLALLFVTACVLALLVLGGGDQQGLPTETTVAQVTATGESPPATEVPLPTEPPPTEVPPTEPPPPTEELPPTEVPPTEPPPPTEEPPVEPTQEPPVGPTEEPPAGATDEPEGGPGPELPCLPAASPLLLVPLMVRKSRKNQI